MKQTSTAILEKLVQFIGMIIGCVIGLLIYRSCEAKKQAEPEASHNVIGSDYIDLYPGEDNLNIPKDDFIKLEKITDEIYVDIHTNVIYVWPNNCPYRPIIEADGTALTLTEWSKRYYDEHHKE